MSKERRPEAGGCFCAECDETFGSASTPPLFHCQGCDGHYQLADGECSNCHAMGDALVPLEKAS